MNLSLAGWSLQSLFRASPPGLTLLDFPQFTRKTFGLDAIELNNIFFESTRPDYLDKLRLAADDAGVRLVNIAVDEHGDLASTNVAARAIAVANYARWIPVAAYLGINAIRANSGTGDPADPEASANCCIDSFKQLCDIGRRYGVKLLIENHWGLSFDPTFIVRLVNAVRQSHGDAAIAVLADFGNWPDTVDRYDALEQIMPLAGGVHAKINQIDEQLNHPRFDHARCLAIARRAGYAGYLGIEAEAGEVDAIEAVRRGVRLLSSLISVK